ncbi:MAG: hypothetical protein UT29_C0001G0029 [Candidatus Yanofskybacteria bacterium GW2011_GWA1_39_13]|uniref:Uncharacterized protein n=1 Tax=Yanofskybacteria sp. (strain GW2011_GWA1_39_13) TaxID=1619019 RepID=A0A0G0MEP5_YANXG|nr:MAG: hypothetical protein UT29_C0001G0029 [Candidatus Yanofskybacteria bacterium GW2011_GWA1_39_13]
MSVTPRLEDFDHTIHDSRGIVGVKDGIEYPVSKEEWDKAHPEHRNTGCKECTFVQDKDTLLTFIVPREAKEGATKEPKDCGIFTMPGWTGHSHFYLFKCVECGKVTVDYPHGYHGPYWYLRCDDCECTFDLSSSKFRSIYKDNNGFVPKFIEEIGGWLKRQLALLRR